MIIGRVRALTALAATGLLLAALPASPAGAASPIATVKVGGQPTGIVITPDSAMAYVSNSGANTVNVINIASGALVTSIPVGKNPQPPAISGDGTKVVVSCNGDDTVKVISTKTNSVTASIVVGDAPGQPLVVGSRAYVSNFGGNSVSVVDLTSETVVATIPVGAGPTTGILGTGDQYQAYTSTLFIPNGSAGTISLINTGSNTVTSTSTIGGTITGAAVSPGLSGTTDVFVSSTTYSSLAILSQRGGAPGPLVSVGGKPSVPAVNIDGTRVFISNAGSKSVSVVAFDSNPAAVVATVPVGSSPGKPVMDRSGSSMYVPNFGGSTVSVLSTSTNAVKATYQVGKGPMGVALTSSGTKMLVSNSKDGTVSIVSLASSTLAKAPKSVSVSTSTSKKATVSWKKSTASSVTGYVVTALPGGATCSTTGTKCTIKGMTGGKSYTFAVQTKNKYGAGAPATSKSATIKK